MPRNSKDVEGPSVFSGERGTPSFENADWTTVSCLAAGKLLGEMTRKSSRRWMRYGIA